MNITRRIEDHLTERKIWKAINQKLKELGIMPSYAPKNLYAERSKRSSTARMAILVGVNTRLHLEEAVEKFKQERGNYIDVKVIGKKEEVRKVKVKGREQYNWRIIEENNKPEGYLEVGSTKYPYGFQELEEFDRDVLDLEKQGEILPHQLKDLVRAQEAVEWNRRREEIKQNARERWERGKSCPECGGQKIVQSGANNSKTCEICKGSGEIKSIEEMEGIFLSRQENLGSIIERKWFKYEQQRLEQMKELGLRKPSYEARVYVKISERKL